MDPERPACAPPPCTLHPSNEPGFMSLPFFPPCDSTTSWDLCAPIPAAESLGTWENSSLWDGGSLLITGSSQGHLETPEEASFISLQSPLDPTRFPLAQPWDGLSPDTPTDAAPDFVHPPVTAARLDPDVDEVLAHVSHILSCHPKGMRVKWLVRALMKERGVDLWAFSRGDGFRGVVSFLREVPGIQLWNPEKGEKCRVLSCTFKKDVADPLPLLCSTLGSFPDGLRVFSLWKVMWQRHGVNLEAYSQQRGYVGTLDYLTSLPEVRLQGLERGDKCLVQLQTAASIPTLPPLDPAGFPSPQFCTGPTPDGPPDAAPNPTQPPVAAACLDPTDLWLTSKTNPDVADPLPLLCSTLDSFPDGLRVVSLRKAMWQRHGVNLEAYSQQRGYVGTLDYLTSLPEVRLQGLERGDKCLVQLQTGVAVTPPTPQLPPDPALPSAWDSSTPPPDAPDAPSPPADVEPMEAPGQAPDVGTMALLIQDVLAPLPQGMRVKKLTEALARMHGVDLEAFSQARGYGDVVSFLRDVPGLSLQAPEKGKNCLVRLWTEVAVTPPTPQLPPDPAPPSALDSSIPPPDAPDAPSPPADVEPMEVPGQAPGLAEVSASVREVLGHFPLGLKVGKLKVALQREHGLDLEVLSRQQGCGDALGLLRGLPHLWLQDLGKGDACLAWLGADAAVSPTAPARQKKRRCLVADVGTMARLIRDLLAPLPQGMQVKKLTEALAGKHGLDLEAFSQDRGYKDVVSFLGDVPGLAVRETEKGDNWLVQLWRGVGVKSPILKLPPDPAAPSAWDSSTPPPDAADAPSLPADVEPMEAPGQAPGLAEVSASVREVLGRFPLGLKVGKLKVALQREHGLDLEVLSRQQGCGDALGLLRGLPHFWLQDPGKGDTCLAWLGTDAAVSPTAPARRKKRRCLVADVGTMALLIRDLLAPLPQGMRVKKLTEALARKHGVNLEAFSQARGYGDVVSILRDVPGLSLQAPEKGKNCLVRLWTDVAEVLKLLKRLLRTYTSGLRLKKVQEFLLERHGLDLKAFVNSQGYEDVVGFLQSRLPGLEYRRPEKGEKCIIRLGTGQKGSSGSLPPDGAQPLPGSKRCPLPTNAAKRPAPPASSCLNPRLPSALTNQPLLPGLPSGQEPLGAPAILGKLGKSPGATPCLPPWLLSPPQPTGARSGLQVDDETQESGARCASIPLVLRAEEGTQQSGAQLGSVPLNPRAGSPEAPACRSPEDLMELKRKVGDILAGHPGGMSLFQLRAAYSASHQHPLPLGHTASTRQRLAQMPDVVRIQGYGVQTLLLPVAPDEPPGAEPGLAWWIPQEAAGLAGDPDAPAGAPPAPTGPDLGGDPNVLAEPPPAPAELPPTPAGPDLGGDMNALARPPPAPAEPPPTSTGPALGGDPHTLVEPPPAPAELPPTPAGPALGGDPDTPAELPPAPAEPPPSPPGLLLPGDMNALAKPLPAPAEPPPTTTGPALGGDPDTLAEPPPAPAESPPIPAGPALGGAPHTPAKPPPDLARIPPVPHTPLCPEAAWPEVPDDPCAAARPVVHSPAWKKLLAHASPELPSWRWEEPGPLPAGHKVVQLVSPFQSHPWAEDAPCATPQAQLLPRGPGQSQDMPAAVGPIPAIQAAGLDPAEDQAVSSAKQLPLVAPGPLPAPDAGALATPNPFTEGWPESGRPESGGDVGSPFDPLWHCSPDQPAPAAGRTQPETEAGSPSAPPAPSPERCPDSCIVL